MNANEIMLHGHVISATSRTGRGNTQPLDVTVRTHVGDLTGIIGWVTHPDDPDHYIGREVCLYAVVGEDGTSFTGRPLATFGEVNYFLPEPKSVD